MTSTPTRQSEFFEAETTWFHIFKAMIESGDLARMDGSTIKVYLVIKAHTNFATGRAFPAIETIAAKAGISEPQVKRCLKALESQGYIAKERQGRSNVYTLREKVQITDGKGRPTAVATWDYLPASVKEAVADLKNVLVSGDFGGAKVVHIERLQVNVNHVADGGVVINFQDSLAQLPLELQEKVRSLIEKARNRHHGNVPD